jgi:hypothetical protein
LPKHLGLHPLKVLGLAQGRLEDLLAFGLSLSRGTPLLLDATGLSIFGGPQSDLAVLFVELNHSFESALEIKARLMHRKGTHVVDVLIEVETALAHSVTFQEEPLRGLGRLCWN